MAMQALHDSNGRRTALLYARLIDPGTGLDETGGVLIEDGNIIAFRTKLQLSYKSSTD